MKRKEKKRKEKKDPALPMEEGVVIDLGQTFTKAGFIGESSPTSILPSIIGFPIHSFLPQPKDYYVGDEAQSKRGVLRIQRPVKEGEITSWEDFSRLCGHVVEKELSKSLEETPVVMSLHPQGLSSFSSRGWEVVFEEMKTPSFLLCPAPCLACYAVGGLEGVVAQSGARTRIAAVSSGLLLKDSLAFLPLGGFELTDYLGDIMNQRGYCMKTSSPDTTVCNKLKETTCFVSLDFEKASGLASSSSCFEKPFELPDGQIISIEGERFRAPEILFQPHFYGLEAQGFSDLIVGAQQHLPSETNQNPRKIILCGGNTLIPDMKQRIEKDIFLRQPNLPQPEVISLPERHFLEWKGGSILGSLSVSQDFVVSAKDYQEIGSYALEKRKNSMVA